MYVNGIYLVTVADGLVRISSVIAELHWGYSQYSIWPLTKPQWTNNGYFHFLTTFFKSE